MRAKNVILKPGDLFATDADGIVIPCSTDGSIEQVYRDGLWENHAFQLPDRRQASELGSIDIARWGHDARAKHKKSSLVIIFATCFGEKLSQVKIKAAARSVLTKIAEYSKSEDAVKSIAMPLLGYAPRDMKPDEFYQSEKVLLAENGNPECQFEIYAGSDGVYKKLVPLCNHRYHSSDEKVCPYPAIYEAINRACKKHGLPEKLNHFRLTLLHDGEGECIFHSQDNEFKKHHQANDQFQLLVPFIAWARKVKELKIDVLDFEDFIFAGQRELHDAGLENDGTEVNNLSDITFSDYTSFRNCKFYGHTWLSHCKFIKKATFEQARFLDHADFSNTVFENLANFEDTLFRASASFTNTVFNTSAQFEGSRIDGALSFYETIFKSYVSFEKAKILSLTMTKAEISQDINHSMVNFRYCQIRELFRLEKVKFEGEVDFKKAILPVTEIIDVSFSQERITSFDGIQLKGNMVIKSLNPNQKIFSHLVSFDLSAQNLIGEIVFENCNVFFIKQLDALKQLALPSVRKVVFGPGCDKYKLRREFEVPLTEEWSFLIREMADSFVSFFNWDNPVHLVIQVECEYFKTHAVVRYFADADLDEDEFSEVLAKRAPVFFKFLKHPQLFMKKHLEKLKVTPTAQELTEDIDVYRKINSLRTGLAVRIKIDDGFNADHLEQLFKAIEDHPSKKFVLEFNNYVINQKDFFSFGTNKYLSSGDITINEKK